MPTAPPRDATGLFHSARAGDRVALARLLSLIERGGRASREVSAMAFQKPGDAYSIGITGAPGAGKSTLTDGLITEARRSGFGGGNQVAVVAVDPSSPFSGGAILGDRVRMGSHAGDDGVYIRSMATRGHLGGLTLAVPDALRVLASVGMSVLVVETVGVGQQEVEVAAATDSTVVVLNPGWGDAVQANKAGLLEIADIFVINKADRPGVRETERDLELMLDLTVLDGWRPPIVETVASAGDGVDELWSAISDHRHRQIEIGALEATRRERLERELRRILAARVQEEIGSQLSAEELSGLISAMAAGDLDPYEAAEQLLATVRRRDSP